MRYGFIQALLLVVLASCQYHWMPKPGTQLLADALNARDAGDYEAMHTALEAVVQGDYAQRVTHRAQKERYKSLKRADGLASEARALTIWQAMPSHEMRTEMAYRIASFLRRQGEDMATAKLQTLEAQWAWWRSHQWYLRAAQGGHAEAMKQVARNLRYGRGCVMDESRAEQWYEAAIRQGNEAAADEYQRWLTKREQQERQPQSIMKKTPKISSDFWQQLDEAQLRAAAEEGNVQAMRLLGYRAQVGVSGEADYHEALDWYRKASQAGDEEATLLLQLLQQEKGDE